MDLILITGMPGSGKTEVADEFGKAGVPAIVMGDVIRTETRRRGLEPDSINTKSVMLDMRQENGPGAVAKRCVSKLNGLESNIAAIEGCRSLSEVEVFEEYAESVKILCVHASPSTRFKRLQNRGRKDAPLDWESFKERDLREISVGLGGVIALSDIMLVNEGTIDEIHNSVKEQVEVLKLS